MKRVIDFKEGRGPMKRVIDFKHDGARYIIIVDSDDNVSLKMMVGGEWREVRMTGEVLSSGIAAMARLAL